MSKPLKVLLSGTAISLVLALVGCSGGQGSQAAPQPGDDSGASGAQSGASSGAPLFASAAVGDIVIFGSYDQNNTEDDGQEPIEWRVLAVDGNRILLVSERALDRRTFNASDKQGNSWESSDLKAWLEGEFADAAFSESEQSIIAEITCLSVDEAKQYFPDESARVCKPTAYAAMHGVVTYNGGCYWWLRTPGTNGKEYVAFVTGDGRVMAGGGPVSNEDRAVRPALWISL